MTATDELRALLDERGVEWWSMHDDENGYREDRDTEFLIYGCKHVAHEWGCRLQVDMLTPAQAVEATLGRGKCKIEFRCDCWYCTGCGDMVGSADPWDERCTDGNAVEAWDYCPSCGREVER